MAAINVPIGTDRFKIGIGLIEFCEAARQFLTRTSRNQRGECGRCWMRRVEAAANPSLTVGAPSLDPEFSATFARIS